MNSSANMYYLVKKNDLEVLNYVMNDYSNQWFGEHAEMKRNIERKIN